MEAPLALNALLSSLAGCKTQHIVIKGSPDPDALASAWALALIGESVGLDWKIYIEQALSLPENQLLVKAIGLRLKPLESLEFKAKEGDGYSVVDHPDPTSPLIPDWLPCLVHIDHHALSEKLSPASFRCLNPESGATASILIEYLDNQRLKIGKRNWRLLTSVLLAGILTDTDQLKLASELDHRAVEFLSPFVDEKLVASISQPAVSDEILAEETTAEREASRHQDWLISGLGYIPAAKRDMIAIVADRMLENHSEVEAVAVFAAIEDQARKKLTLDVSIRSRDGQLDLEQIIKTITQHGGARRYKGAFQIKLNYLLHCKDRKLAWNVLEDATRNALYAALDKYSKTNLIRKVIASWKGIFKSRKN